MNRRLKLGAVAAAVLALSACGGGGGGDGKNNAAPQVEGAAIKGVIRNATVTLIELTGSSLDPKDGRVLATGTTDGAGRYSLSPSGYQGGPVLVRIQGLANQTTEVFCDFDGPTDNDCGQGVKHGDTVKVDNTFIIESILPSLGNGANAINVTALTQVLVARAQALMAGNSLSAAEAIRQAASQVNQLAGGIDVVRTRPVDFSQSIPNNATAAQIAYAALNAAVLGEADPAKPSQEAISGAVANLATEFADARIDNARVRALAERALQQLPAGTSDSAGILTALRELTSEPGEFAPPATSGDEAGAAAGKRFVADIRNTIQRYEQLDASEHAATLRLEKAAALGDAKATEMHSSLAAVLSQAVSLYEQNVSSGTIFTQDSSGATQEATATFAEANGVTTASIQGRGGDNTVNLQLKFPTELAQASGAAHLVDLSGVVESAASEGLRLEVRQGKAEIVTGDASQAIEDEDPNTPAGQNIDKVLLDLTVLLSQKGATHPISFEGTIGFGAVQCRTSEGAACPIPTGDTEVAVAPTRFVLSGELSDDTGALLKGSITLAIAESDARKFNAHFPYSSTNFLPGTITVSTRGKLPDFPDLQLTLAVVSKGYLDETSEHDGVPLGEMTLTLTENDRVVLRVSSENSATSPTPSAMRIEDGNGAVLELSRANGTGPVHGELRINDKRAATVQQSSSGLVRIVYEDGTFETLFH